MFRLVETPTDKKYAQSPKIFFSREDGKAVLQKIKAGKENALHFFYLSNKFYKPKNH